MSEGANSKSFADCLAFTLIHDSGFSPAPGGGGLVKRDLGASSYVMVMCVVSNGSTQEQVINNINNSLLRVKNIAHQDGARHSVMMSIIYVFENYADFSPYLAPVFRQVQEEMDKNGMLVDLIIYDMQPGIYVTVSGRKPDKNIRQALEESKQFVGMDYYTRSQILEGKRQQRRTVYEQLRPVRHKNPINPVIVLIVINVAIFILDLILETKFGYKPFRYHGIQNSTLILDGDVWRLFTAMFLHADIGHLAGNMISLLYLGFVVRRYYTDIEFMIIYLLSGLFGSFLSFLFMTNSFSLGASGAIMGLGGVLIYRMFFGKHAKSFRQAGNYLILAFMVLYNLFYGLTQTGIDNYGHFGGFAAGFLIALIINTIRLRRGKNV